MDHESWQVERRTDGAVVVRVPSLQREDGALPDAVFAFRLGDPQYSFWRRKLEEQDERASS